MIFLDSSFLVAFEVDGDINHDSAVRLLEDIIDARYGLPVISDYIFDETMTVTLLRTKSLRKARLAGESLLKSFTLLMVDETAFRRAWQSFKGQRATKYSFTDSTTLELMRRNSIRRIATFDRDFLHSREVEVVGA